MASTEHVPRKHLLALGVAASVLAALSNRAAVVGYDTMFHHVWAHELLTGAPLSIDSRLSPTPHPLQLVVALILVPAGDLAPAAMRMLHVASLGALGVGVFELGRRWLSAWVGAVAALLLVPSPYLLDMAHRATADLPAVTMLVWAAVLEERRRRRGAPVLALLALAGLLRPEYWLVSAAYLLWCWRGLGAGPRVRLLAIAAAAPLLWVAFDLALTRNPFFSLERTRANSHVPASRGLFERIWFLPQYLKLILGPAPLVVGVIGLALGAVFVRRRILAVSVAAAVGGGTFAVLSILKVSVQPRYLLPAVVAIALLAAVGAAGWTAPDLSERTRVFWRAFGVLAAVFLAAGAVRQVAVDGDVRSTLVGGDEDLVALLQAPQAGDVIRRCGNVAVANAAMAPYVAFALRMDPRLLGLGTEDRPEAFVAPTPRGASSLRGASPAGAQRHVPAPEDYRVATANDRWVVLAGRC